MREEWCHVDVWWLHRIIDMLWKMAKGRERPGCSAPPKLKTAVSYPRTGREPVAQLPAFQNHPNVRGHCKSAYEESQWPTASHDETVCRYLVNKESMSPWFSAGIFDIYKPFYVRKTYHSKTGWDSTRHTDIISLFPLHIHYTSYHFPHPWMFPILVVSSL